jgi:hypothetical protein
MENNKVYCINCKYYDSYYVDGGCNCPTNLRSISTWMNTYNDYIQSCLNKNSQNNCTDFVAKRKWWKFWTN